MAIGLPITNEDLQSLGYDPNNFLTQLGLGLHSAVSAYSGQPNPIEAQIAQALKLQQARQDLQLKPLDRLEKGMTSLGALYKIEGIPDEAKQQLAGAVFGSLRRAGIPLSPKIEESFVSNPEPYLSVVPLVSRLQLPDAKKLQLHRDLLADPEKGAKKWANAVMPAFMADVTALQAQDPSLGLEDAKRQVASQPEYAVFAGDFKLQPQPEVSGQQRLQGQSAPTARYIAGKVLKGEMTPEQGAADIAALPGQLNPQDFLRLPIAGQEARLQSQGRLTGEAQAYQMPGVGTTLARQKGLEAGATAKAQAPYQIQVSQAQGENAARLAQDKPITTTDLNNVLDPKTYRPVPFGTTYSQAKQMGAVFVSEPASKRLEDINAAEGFTDELRALGEKLYGPGGPLADVTQANALAGRLRGSAVAKYNQLTQSDPDIQDAKGLIALYQTQASRVTAGEKGQSTQQDIERAAKAIPKLEGLPDTKERFFSSLDLMQSLHARIRRRIVTGPPSQGTEEPPAGPKTRQPAPKRTPQQIQDEIDAYYRQQPGRP